jgi:DHA1 family bicyclomycin/chloramphenicol resistance-like MFS transporter
MTDTAGTTVTAPRYLVPLLAAFTSLVVLTTDVYLPVLPQLGQDLGTSDAAAAATLSAVLIGIAVGQIVVGPLSDAVGRRKPLLLGAVAYSLTHLLSALAPNVLSLLAIRLLAGLATAACIVVCRAIVADVYPGSRSARAFATLSAVMAIVPVLAPVMGGLLAHVMSWRGMFVLLAAVAVALSLVCLL